MTQDKMRRMITACVSAATVLLVFLLGFLIYQWISIGVTNRKIEKIEQEIAVLEQQLQDAETEKEVYMTETYLSWKLAEIELLKGK